MKILCRDFILKKILYFKISAEKLAYFLRKYKFHRQITREFLGLSKQNIQSIVFISTKTNEQMNKF